MIQQTSNFLFWWEHAKGQAHESLYATVKTIASKQAYRRERDIDYLRLYGSMEGYLRSFMSMSFKNTPQQLINNRLAYNVVQSVVDTLVSRLAAKDPVKVQFLTTNGPYHQQRKAENLTTAINGTMDRMKVKHLVNETARDAFILGTGIVKHAIVKDPETKKLTVKFEKVIALELFMDDLEAVYGQPQNLYQVKSIPRSQLLKDFPNKRIEIETAPPMYQLIQTESAEEHLEVLEAWSISQKRHILAISNASLVDEDYNDPFFPFIFLRYTSRPLYFWGMGITERLIGIQLEINRLVQRQQQLLRIHGVPWVLLNRNDEIPDEQVNNRPFNIVSWTNAPPEVKVFQCMTPEIPNQIENLYRKAFDIAGLSQASATSHIPSNLKSGTAIRESLDVEADRFLETQANIEQFWVDLAERLVILLKRIGEAQPEHKLAFKNKNILQEINWKDIDLPEDAFVISQYPVSTLPSKPEGRLDFVNEMMQIAQQMPDVKITQKQWLGLLNFPDFQALFSLDNAAEDLINAQIDDIIYNNTPHQPDPKSDLNYAFERATQTYLLLRKNNIDNPEEPIPEQTFQLLDIYLEQVKDLLTPQETMAQGAINGNPSNPNNPGNPNGNAGPPNTAGPSNPSANGTGPNNPNGNGSNSGPNGV